MDVIFALAVVTRAARALFLGDGGDGSYIDSNMTTLNAIIVVQNLYLVLVQNFVKRIGIMWDFQHE